MYTEIASSRPSRHTIAFPSLTQESQAVAAHSGRPVAVDVVPTGPTLYDMQRRKPHKHAGSM